MTLSTVYSLFLANLLLGLTIFSKCKYDCKIYFKEFAISIRHLVCCRLKEACILLSLAAGSAKLMAEVLRDEPDPTEALAELGVYRLNPSEAREILSRRNDISAADL